MTRSPLLSLLQDSGAELDGRNKFIFQLTIENSSNGHDVLLKFGLNSELILMDGKPTEIFRIIIELMLLANAVDERLGNITAK